MAHLFDVCDEMASGTDFVTFREIMECFYGHGISKLEGDKNYATLRKRLDRLGQIVEYKNGKNSRAGFRYKRGNEYYFRNNEEKKALKKLEGDEKQLFLTGGLQMLFDGESSMEHLVELECVSELQNLDLVKKLVKYLGLRVISFKYMKGYKEEKEVFIHPFLLKEYNSRWFLFGYVHQEDDSWEIVNIALDRIVYSGKPYEIKVYPDIEIKKVPEKFCQNYFKDIVGVTKPENGVVETIVLRTTDFKVHHLLRTKPIHSSQQETMPFNEEKKEGEFTIRVIPNIELQARLLGYGPGLYLVGDSKFQQQMRDAVSKMKELYE